MSWKKVLGLMSSATLVGVVAVANGCSSSSNKGSATDAGSDAVIIVHKDASGSGGDDGNTGDDGSTATVYDGTTGKACTGDADCQPAGGAGVNICTSTNPFQGNSLYPSPVCLDPKPCDPGTDGFLHFCDGPDASTSPGVCLQGATAGEGVCLPQCNFKPDGSAVTGCVGKDACFVDGFAQNPSNANAAIGIGYCFAGCDSDADCGTGQHCQTDDGTCVATLATDAAVGTACTVANGTSTPTCNCISSTQTGKGYCAQFCHTGGTECGAGEICDAELPLELTTSADASIPGWTAANPGLGGFCSPTCTVDGGTAADGGNGCPPNATCLPGDFGGPDCLP